MRRQGLQHMSVYRMFAADGELLYVGVTNNTHRRFQQHAAEKAWWPQVDRIETEDFYCPRCDAEAEEAVAIWQERPRYNIDDPILRRYHPKRGPRANDLIDIYDSMAALFDGIQKVYDGEPA